MSASPPAPPRSEQETALYEPMWFHRGYSVVVPDDHLTAWTQCVAGPACAMQQHSELIPTAALEGAARDAAKKERETTRSLCDAWGAYIESGSDEDYAKFEDLMTEVIRALPPEEK